MGIPGSTSLQTSESMAFGDQRTATKGQATANIGLVNAVFGRGDALSASASAGASGSPWVWVALAGLVVGGAPLSFVFGAIPPLGWLVLVGFVFWWIGGPVWLRGILGRRAT
jgi:hypothetical protein